MSRLEIIARDAIAVATWLPLASALACAGGVRDAERAGAPTPELASSAPADAVRVRLVFGADADLDLYVTGPSAETVYFANDTSQESGRLVADRRCDSPAPRVETIEFARAAAGRYRVGVDFMMRCARGVDRAPFEVIAEVPGQPAIHRRGEADFGVFDPRVLEFSVSR